MKTQFCTQLCGLTFAAALVIPVDSTLAQPGSLDATFTPAELDGYVWDVAVQSDGRILAGGSFTHHNGSVANQVVRLNSDGSRDSTFSVGLGANGWVMAIALIPDGRILVGGNFSTMNGVQRSGLARLNADGSVDSSYDALPGAVSTIQVIKVMADGRVLVGGTFRTFGGAPHVNIVRLMPDGTVDESFQAQTDDGLNGWVEDIAVAPDGRVYISGGFISVNGVDRPYTARLWADGSVDESFYESLRAFNGKLNLQPDGKLVIGGSFTGAAFNLVRLNPDGSVDPTFQSPICDPGADPSVEAVALQADGKILFGGANLSCAPMPNNVNRIDPYGNGDDAFLPPALIATNFVTIYKIVLQPDGRILVAFDGGLVRLNNRAPDVGIEFTSTSFWVSESNRVARVTLQRTGPSRRAALVRLEVKDGTATARSDYLAWSHWILFRRGETSKTVPILIRRDAVEEEDETVLLSLRRAIGGTLGLRTDALLIIRDSNSSRD